MSIGMVLEGVRDWLREKNGWTNLQCGVVEGGWPIARAGQFYVGIDEDGVDVGPENTHALTEIFKLEISVWRRPGHLPKDMQGDMALPEDRYLPEISTLHALERQVVEWLHAKWSLAGYINLKYGLPDATRGDRFIGALMSSGRGRRDTYPADNGVLFIGRRLRFRGLKRIQKICD